jgi:hypothetical protein
MYATSCNFVRAPTGRIMGNIRRLFLASLHQQLLLPDIERSYYPLLVIESGKWTGNNCPTPKGSIRK